MGGGFLKPRDPRIGSDLAGRVEAVGESVTHFRPGDEVFGCGAGAFAEYALAKDTRLVLKPANRSFEEAAAVPVAALTALQGLRDAGKIQSGQKVLIQGASGGVGIFAIQLAKSFGAEVTAVCITKNLEMASSLGADHIIDYTRQDFTQNQECYDLIFAVNGYHPISAYKRALNPQEVPRGSCTKRCYLRVSMKFKRSIIEPDTQHDQNEGRYTNPHNLTGEDIWCEVNALIQRNTLSRILTDVFFPWWQTVSVDNHLVIMHT